jgi:hypothetical protein
MTFRLGGSAPRGPGDAQFLMAATSAAQPSHLLLTEWGLT